MGALSDLPVWFPFLLVALLAVLIWGGFRGRAFLVCLGLSILVGEGLIVQSLKKTIERPRPKQTQTVRLIQLERTTPKFLTLLHPARAHYSQPWQRSRDGKGRSFPSAHVVNNFVAGTLAALFFRRWGWPYYGVAALVGYSRIYVGAHWPSDVLTSAFLGIGLALLVAAFSEWLWRIAGARWAPQLFAKHPRLLPHAA